MAIIRSLESYWRSLSSRIFTRRGGGGGGGGRKKTSENDQLALFANWGKLFMLFFTSADFFQSQLFSKNQFGSRSDPTFCWPWSVYKLFAKDISRRY